MRLGTGGNFVHDCHSQELDKKIRSVTYVRLLGKEIRRDVVLEILNMG